MGLNKGYAPMPGPRLADLSQRREGVESILFFLHSDVRGRKAAVPTLSYLQRLGEVGRIIHYVQSVRKMGVVFATSGAITNEVLRYVSMRFVRPRSIMFGKKVLKSFASPAKLDNSLKWSWLNMPAHAYAPLKKKEAETAANQMLLPMSGVGGLVKENHARQGRQFSPSPDERPFAAEFAASNRDEAFSGGFDDALEGYFFRQSRLAPSGGAAFNPRLSPLWAGLKLPV